MNKYVIVIVSLVFSLSSLFLKAQELPSTGINAKLPTVIPPSPTVANLMRFEEVPVDLYSGQASINIPLFNQPISNDLAINIGLSYNTQGIRVDERSGWVGTGWSLNAGGVISRTVMDVPDEENTSNLKIGVFHNGFFNWENFSISQMDEFLYKAYRDIEHYDTQPDLYQFNFMGYTGRFIIIKNTIGDFEVKFLSDDQKIKVSFEFDQLNKILKFELIDPKGYVYHFESREQTQSEQFTASISQNNQSSLNTPGPTSHYSAWHLTKIFSSNNNLLCEFFYDQVTEAYGIEGGITTYEVTTPNSANQLFSAHPYYDPYNDGVYKPKQVISYSGITVETQKLKQIIFRNDKKIDIQYDSGTLGNPEVGGGAILKALELSYNNQKIKSYDLVHQISTNNRLFLTEVKSYGNTNSYDSYILNYDNLNNLPAYGDFNVDIWGYYNFPNNVLSNDKNLTHGTEVDTKSVTVGVLESIVFPTGGTQEFVFESNSFSYQGGGNTIDSHTIPENFNILSASRTYTGNITQPPTQEISIYINDKGDVRLDKRTVFAGSEVILGTQGNHIIYFTPVLQNGTIDNSRATVVSDVLEPSSNFTRVKIGLEQGWYKITIGGGGYLNPNPEYGNYEVELEIIYLEYELNQSFRNGGGLRIKEVLFKDDNVIKDEIRYTYHDFMPGANPNPIGLDFSSGSYDGFLSKTREYSLEKTYKYYALVRYDVTEKSNSLLTTMTKGNYIGYKYVYKNRVDNGYTKNTFSSFIDYPSYPVGYGFPFKPVEDIDFKRGLLLEQEVYSQDDTILKSITNTYDIQSTNVVRALSIRDSSNNCEDEEMYNRYDNYLSGIPNILPPYPYAQPAPYLNCGSVGSYIGMGSVPFYYINGKSLLEETITKDYFYDAQGVQNIKETRQEFEYNPVNYQIKEQHTYYKEKGIDEHYQTKYYYPTLGTPTLGSNTIEIKQKLRELNKINEVLGTETFKNGIKISQTNTIYNEFETDLVLPQQVETAKGTDTPEERIKFHTYDSYGNPLEVSKTGGTAISYVWGYDHTLPVAKVVNATFADIESLPSFGVGFSLTGGLSTVQENDLRGLVEAQISTFEYDPMVGVISTTDARGYTVYYYYDDFNRLEYVKDQDGNILSENEYNYKN